MVSGSFPGVCSPIGEFRRGGSMEEPYKDSKVLVQVY